MATTDKPVNVMDSEELAKKAKAMRRSARLTQRELADRLIKAGYADSLTVQAISQAENAEARADMSKLRVAIIQHLSGRELAGPVWYFSDEVPQ